MKRIDARGLSCPEPVLLTKKAAAAEHELEVLVDNKIALNNITRFATNAGYAVEPTQAGDDFCLKLTK